MSSLSFLNYLLLALIGRKSRNANQLRNAFSELPQGLFSDSPGSIYPALKKMVILELVETKDRGKGKRRAPYRLTPSGRDILFAWLRQPVQISEMVSVPAKVALRIAFAGAFSATDQDVPMRLKEMHQHALKASKELEHYRLSADAHLARSSKMSLDLAEEMLSGYARWAERWLKQVGD